MMNKDYLFVSLLTLIMVAPAYAGELPDPTRPPLAVAMPQVVKAKEQPVLEWRLSMIRVSRIESIALLNGTLVREGDDVLSARVVKITPSSVLLEEDGKRFDVHVSKGIGKRLSGQGNPD